MELGDDMFGRSVALDGDTLAVAAPQEDSSATGVKGDQADNSAERSGAVYVFTRDGNGTWSQQAFIKESNTDGSDGTMGGFPGDGFGSAIALDGAG